MAAASAILSGAFRISNVNVVFNRAFSGIVTVSTWLTQEILLANGVSDTVFSFAQLQIPGVIMLIGATSICRVNFTGTVGGGSSVSAASAGMQFKDFWGVMGSGIAGVSGIHLANSSGDSALLTLVMAQ